jgi:hypothetical protein
VKIKDRLALLIAEFGKTQSATVGKRDLITVIV